MGAAVAPFRDAVAAVGAMPGTIPVISGLTGQPFTDLAAELSDALIGPVRWREVMARLVALGAERFTDVGPGRVLDRLAKRNLEEARAAVA
jgi:[acyl-carrier-protein] S-malonyltransferase